MNSKGYNIEIDWKPDKNLNVPVYKQIIEYIKKKIRNGDWIVGQKLPSQRKLAEIFHVNRSTIVAAMDELCSYGILESGFGRGTKVASNTWSILISNNTPNWENLINGGSFQENKPIVKIINKMEYEEGIIRLGTGELSPKLLPKKKIERVFNNVSKNINELNYLEPLGLMNLRKEICRRVKKSGIEAEPDNVLITSGSLQALHLLSICILEKGSKVYTENVSYVRSLNLFQSSGISLCGIPMDKEGMDFYKISQLKNDSHLSSIIYTIPSFQNPTNRVMSKNRRKELINFCNENRLPVIEDDAYGELYFEEMDEKPLKSIDKNGIVLYLGSISKTLAPGIRIGWIIGPQSVIKRLGDAKMQIDYGVSSISQWFLYEFYSSGLYDEYLESIRSELKKKRNIMIEYLEKHYSDIASWNIPQGGFYIWVKFNNNIDTDKLFYKAVQNKVIVNPGSIYGAESKNYIRFSYAYEDEERMKKGLKIIRKLIDDEMIRN